MAQNTVAIVGVGTVGSQVAQLAAEAGWTVIGIEKDAPTAEAAAQRSGVEVGTDLEAAAEAAIVIECLPEKRDLKHAVFAQIGGLAADDAVLVTTATALSVTDLALSSGRPNRVLGLSLPHDPARTQLELVGLTGFGPRSTDTLSGGQAQRVALARALAPQPRVLLLDEPFGALDAVLKAELVLEVQLLLRELGVTVLAVTHDRQEAFTLADRVAVLRDGRLVQVGTPDHLWNDPSDTYVARLVGLSVLEERAYRPEDIRVAQDGPWPAVVTGSTFRDGHYLVSARVGEVPVVFVSAQPREAGAHVRLAT